VSEGSVSKVSDSDASRLERRARRLVRAYPPGYRASRGEEIVGTILEATAPGGNWPSARDTASVIGAGLRARRDANLRQGVAASLRQAAILGAAMYLVQFPCEALGNFARLARWGDIHLPLGSFYWFYFLSGGLAMLILAAAWSGQRRLVAGAAVATAIPAMAYVLIGHEWDLMVTVVAFVGPALAVLLPLVRRTKRPPMSLLWLPCLAMGVTLVEALSSPSPDYSHWSVSQTMLLFPYTTYLSLVTVVVAACWLVTDVRPLAGLVFAFTVARVIYGFAYARSYASSGPVQIAIAITAPLAVACALVWLLRHRTRTSPPATR
jgi:hypothetical protein